jgi:hypothetical protein
MPVRSLKTGTFITVDKECTEEIQRTTFSMDKGGRVWLVCPCCEGQGWHHYGDDDASGCRTCMKQGEYQREEDEEPSQDWPSQN